jgi:glycosyltransferase involved in cell wall biosynthesis
VLVLAKTAGEKLLARFQGVMRRDHASARYSLAVVEDLTRAELYDAMSRHRYLLTLSPREGFGLPPLEAMAAGCTVVGFHGGGGTHYMRTDVNCHVAAYPAMEAVCDGMAAVLEDEDAAERMAAAGLKTAAGYGYEAFERRWIGVLEGLFGGSAGPLR